MRIGANFSIAYSANCTVMVDWSICISINGGLWRPNPSRPRNNRNTLVIFAPIDLTHFLCTFPNHPQRWRWWWYCLYDPLLKQSEGSLLFQGFTFDTKLRNYFNHFIMLQIDNNQSLSFR